MEATPRTEPLPSYETFALTAAPLLVGASAWLLLLLPAEADKAWLLHVAHLWLGGAKLYIDVVEVNPPLIVWFYALPVWVSLHVPGVSDSQALAFMGLALSALSTAVGTWLIKRHPAFTGNSVRQWEFALLLALMYVFYTSELYFFDRDNIFLVMAFPYMLRFMPTLAQQPWPLKGRVLIGCMAAIGFCIKPHTLIVFVALQLLIALQARSLRALFGVENVIIGLFATVYLGLALYFTPEYFQVILPVAMATYSEFANHGEGYAYVPPIIASLALVFSDFRRRQATPYRRDVGYFLGICIAFIAYSLSNNGWGYTYNPMYCVTLFMTGWMLWEYDWLRREGRMLRISVRRINFGLRGCLIVFILHSVLMVMYLFATSSSLPMLVEDCETGSRCWRNNPFVRYMQDNHITSFGTLSLDFGKWVLFMRIPGEQWNTRYNHFWMMPQLIVHGEGFIQSHHWILDYIGKAVADDLNGKKPEVVWVDTSPGFMGYVRRFDYAVFLSRVPEFKDAWTYYRYTYTLDTCKPVLYGMPSECRYDVFSRKP